eukprot:SAG31_NODE_23_length_33717_cov_17.863585_20_plen_455_part_00
MIFRDSSFCCAVLCCAVLCCAVLCCAVLCCAVLCCAVLCRAVPCCAVPCCAVRCCAVLCRAVLCCAVLCCAVLCCAVLCCAVLCCAVLCCAVLCCAVLCCAVLCCAVLCCADERQLSTQFIFATDLTSSYARLGNGTCDIRKRARQNEKASEVCNDKRHEIDLTGDDSVDDIARSDNKTKNSHDSCRVTLGDANIGTQKRQRSDRVMDLSPVENQKTHLILKQHLTSKSNLERSDDCQIEAGANGGQTAAQVTSEEDGVPRDFYCAITQEIMIDPVICGDGHSYERDAIELWFRRSNRSPRTGMPLQSIDLIPNHSLRGSIEALLTSRPKLREESLAAASERSKASKIQPNAGNGSPSTSRVRPRPGVRSAQHRVPVGLPVERQSETWGTLEDVVLIDTEENQSSSGTTSSSASSSSALSMLGFTSSQIQLAMTVAGGDRDRAVQILLDNSYWS